MDIIIQQLKPVVDYSMRGLCVRPYPGHKKGCPNFGRKKGCPPQVEKFEAIYDMAQPIYAIINRFDFKAHTDKMRGAHPTWSELQVVCCLYWQQTARKQLLVGIKKFMASHHQYHVTACPEAMGINITQTLADIGIILEWPPKTVSYQVALAGIKIKSEQATPPESFFQYQSLFGDWGV